jgi:hypothetical protein
MPASGAKISHMVSGMRLSVLPSAWKQSYTVGSAFGRVISRYMDRGHAMSPRASLAAS